MCKHGIKVKVYKISKKSGFQTFFEDTTESTAAAQNGSSVLHIIVAKLNLLDVCSQMILR